MIVTGSGKRASDLGGKGGTKALCQMLKSRRSDGKRCKCAVQRVR